MNGRKFTGIIPILLTPFTIAGQIDHDSLRNLIDFNVAAGVDGLGVAIGSELFKFSERERDELIGSVVRHVAGRVPVIVNTSAAGTDLAVELSLRAQQLGADAVMVYPPFMVSTGAAAAIGHYRTIAAAIDIPMVLQDIPQSPISPAMAGQIASTTRNVRNIKVETLPTVPQVGAMARAVGGAMAVIGGAGGSYMLEEYRRGARGVMPFCSQPAAFVRVWRLLEQDQPALARRIFDESIMAVNRLAAQQGDLFYHVHKQLLVRLGVIETAVVRAPTIAIDADTQSEIDEIVHVALAAPPHLNAKDTSAP